MDGWRSFRGQDCSLDSRCDLVRDGGWGEKTKMGVNIWE